MDSYMTEVERRQHPRFQVRGDVYTINSWMNGRITEISMSGLSFHYVARKQRLPETDRLDIVVDDEEYRLGNLPYTTISEEETANACPDDTLVTMKRSVRFQRLTQDQQEELRHFISRYTAQD